MRELWRQIRNQWNADDTLLSGVTGVSLCLYIGNCWWKAVDVTYAASSIPLAILLLRAVYARRRLLGRALAFAAIPAALWPVGEGLIVRALGWWGQYLAPGMRLWDTALYCVLVGWLAFTYCTYVAWRAGEMGFSRGSAAVVSGLGAFGIGALGENLFVTARMWEYVPSTLDLAHVPAFVPVAYGLGCAGLPFLQRCNLLLGALLFCTLLVIACVALGVLTGFFPR